MSKFDTGRGQMGPPIKLMKKEDDEDFIAIHYEQKLRSIFFEYASSEGSIDDQQQWDVLMSMVIRHKLMSVDDTGKLEKVMPSFPVTFHTLL